jgi:hypothetical protein
MEDVSTQFSFFLLVLPSAWPHLTESNSELLLVPFFSADPFISQEVRIPGSSLFPLWMRKQRINEVYLLVQGLQVTNSKRFQLPLASNQGPSLWLHVVYATLPS